MIRTRWPVSALASFVMVGAVTLVSPGSASAATWQVIPVPAQAVGVVPDSATDAWGMQENSPSYDGTPYASEIVHLSGTTWSALAVPGWPTWANVAVVAADSPTDVWVTGDDNMTHYDGSRWTTYTGLGGGGSSSIAIISPANVWTNGSAPTTGLALQHWDGTKWSPVTAPRPAGAPYASLVGLSASGGDLWALASVPNGGSKEYFADRWDGTSWSLTVVPTPALQGGQACVTNISAASATDVWVLGSNDCYNDGTSFVMHYNGSAWSTFQMPAATFGLVNSIAARGNEAWVVGSTTGHAAAWHWDGSTWSSAAIPVTSANSSAVTVSFVPDSNTVWIEAYDPSTTSGLVIAAGG